MCLLLEKTDMMMELESNCGDAELDEDPTPACRRFTLTLGLSVLGMTVDADMMRASLIIEFNRPYWWWTHLMVLAG